MAKPHFCKRLGLPSSRSAILAAALALGASAWSISALADEPIMPPDPMTIEGADGGATPAATTSIKGNANSANLFGNLQRDVDEFTLVNEKRRLSLHRPLFIMPATYSPQYPGSQTEFEFQISMKLRLFNRNVFFGYTQKSFWQLYNAHDSRPFRETDYNPELFYRWKPQLALCPACGLDVGAEHESNGKDLPDSRSWNRLTLAGYYEADHTLLHLKTWYRIPEHRKTSPSDPNGDDNPDIAHYYGYGELRLQHFLSGDRQLVSLMLRGNPRTGRGAVEFNYSLPYGDALYWNIYVYNGYGESLIDYNRSITRVGIGLMLAR